ncbi:DUF2946 family protein [Paralcaligenes ureilyticus]|uniref:DUF2946 family protein n=1 Tax=Paralcaligenes ureilyticus TaxID=627131 RepID=A0A4R3LQR1_9BURK|nr:DUF2946 family protein [Paralcaligenes ureilyticus]TCT01949.1 DUF2946 family protein [Paralcaligenes ureilyticus]
MDVNVIAAISRWPNVPDVFGWLSLTERGEWRLHPRGDALSTAVGESIANPQILQFIGRNYTGDEEGRWYFQNGPQKVFVRLDAAPYILRTTNETLGLRTHNGLDVSDVRGWWLDDDGRLYAQTEHGPGLIAGRDLAAVLAGLYTVEGERLMDALEGEPDGGLGDIELPRREPIRVAGWVAAVSGRVTPTSGAATSGQMSPAGGAATLLNFCTAAAIPEILGFVRYPKGD